MADFFKDQKCALRRNHISANTTFTDFWPEVLFFLWLSYIDSPSRIEEDGSSQEYYSLTEIRSGSRNNSPTRAIGEIG